MASSFQDELVAQAWAAVSADAAGTRSGLPAPLILTGPAGHLTSAFAVEEVAVATVGVALLAAAALSERRGRPLRTLRLDRGHVADAVRSERYFRVAGRPAGAAFASLSRFWPAADGWVRTHANYPWHRTALVNTLGVPEDIDAVAAALAQLPAEAIEQRVLAAGGIATAVRTLAAWHAHPQGQAVAAEPLISHRLIGDGAPRPLATADLPMTGVRVLDLTRVIAGPVCTRFLGALGADVLRLDPPGHPDMPVGAVADSLLGKRSAFLDLNASEGVDKLHELLARADVVVCGYRPGALDRFGLRPESLAERHPGIVAVFLDAWGTAAHGRTGAASTASCRRPPASRPASRAPVPNPVRFRASSSTTEPVTSPRPQRSTACTGNAPKAEHTCGACRSREPPGG